MGDEVADLLIRYASRLANVGRADVVVVKAIGPHGATVDVTFLLDSGSVMLAESAESALPEPDNSTAIAYMSERTHSLQQPLHVRPSEHEFDDASRSILE